MRPSEFTDAEIIKAGQDLQAAGRTVTGFALRQKIGGGSFSRLKNVWDAHLVSQSVTVVAPAVELPIEVAEEIAAVSKELVDRLAALATGLNDKAVKAAERRVHEVISAAGEQTAQAEREMADAALTVDDLEEKLDATSGRVLELQSDLESVTRLSQDQAIELAQLKERLAASENAANSQAQRHEQELVQAQEALGVQRSLTQSNEEKYQQQRAKAQVAESEVERLRAQLTEVQKNLDLASARERSSIEKSTRELALAQAEVHKLNEKLTEQIQSNTLISGKFENSLKEKDSKIGGLQDQLNTARSTLARNDGELDTLRTQIVSLNETVNRLADTHPVQEPNGSKKQKGSS